MVTQAALLTKVRCLKTKLVGTEIFIWGIISRRHKRKGFWQRCIAHPVCCILLVASYRVDFYWIMMSRTRLQEFSARLKMILVACLLHGFLSKYFSKICVSTSCKFNVVIGNSFCSPQNATKTNLAECLLVVNPIKGPVAQPKRQGHQDHGARMKTSRRCGWRKRRRTLTTSSCRTSRPSCRHRRGPLAPRCPCTAAPATCCPRSLLVPFFLCCRAVFCWRIVFFIQSKKTDKTQKRKFLKHCQNSFVRLIQHFQAFIVDCNFTLSISSDVCEEIGIELELLFAFIVLTSLTCNFEQHKFCVSVKGTAIYKCIIYIALCTQSSQDKFLRVFAFFLLVNAFQSLAWSWTFLKETVFCRVPAEGMLFLNGYRLIGL